MREYLTSIILFFSLLIQEVHLFFSDNVERKVNWILRNYKPMTVAWNVKYLEHELLPILWFLAWTFYRNNFANRLAVRVFLYFMIIDLIMYFYDYKTTQSFFKVYLWMAGFWLLAYKWKAITNYLWKTLHRK